MNTSMRLVTSIALALACEASAQAAVVGLVAPTPIVLSAVGLPVTFGFGAATYTFTAADTGYGSGAAVSTAGSARVSTIFGGMADFGAGSPIDQNGELYTFAPYGAATAIPFSAADDFIGLAFMLMDGIHYGYAEVNGSTLVSYAYESVAGASIQTGATPTAALPTPPGVVPEPMPFALLGIGALAATIGRRRRAV